MGDPTLVVAALSVEVSSADGNTLGRASSEKMGGPTGSRLGTAAMACAAACSCGTVQRVKAC